MINWKVRFNKENILFIAQVILSVVAPVLGYFGLQASDLTTWSMVWQTFLDAISNPYVVLIAAVSLPYRFYPYLLRHYQQGLRFPH